MPILIMVAATMAFASAAFAQVRVINGQTEHVYGPGGVSVENQKAGAGDKQKQDNKTRRTDAPIWSPLDTGLGLTAPGVRLDPPATSSSPR